ncbi:MAG: hypothetical protein GX907_02965 [Clostridiaceae bacterium]|nr:hypothetical protein [Clostridiaceae bacterium]
MSERKFVIKKLTPPEEEKTLEERSWESDPGRVRLIDDDTEKAQPSRWRRFLTNRFNILTVFMLIIALAFIGSLMSLRVDGIPNSPETRGTPRQYAVRPRRGDILDINGAPLATTTAENRLLLAYAGLADREFNAMLLDLSKILRREGLSFSHSIDDWLNLETKRWSPKLREADITKFQLNENLFNLEELPPDKQQAYDNIYIKRDPAVFYRYLTEHLFKIDTAWSEEDRNDVLRLRFEIYQSNWMFINGTPVEITSGLSDELVVQLEEQNYRYRGVICDRKYKRVYLDDAVYFSHVIGYVNRITADEYAKLADQDYTMDDVTGKAGIELSMERYLHGVGGYRNYRIYGTAEENGEEFMAGQELEPQRGYDVRLTLDTRLQKFADQALQDMIAAVRERQHRQGTDSSMDPDAAAIVMLDLRDGAVIAMSSYPGYDPQNFILASEDKTASEEVNNYLRDNVNRPMLNRTMQTMSPPGSTFKPFVSVSALNSGLWYPYTKVYCEGTVNVEGQIFGCLGVHGAIDMFRATVLSCNSYFYNVGLKIGINRISATAYDFGFGLPTGIDLPYETSGIVANRDNKIKYNSDPRNQVWFAADTAQSAIGQGLNAFTLLQLARATGGIATGELVTPYVVSEVRDEHGYAIYRGGTADKQKLPYEDWILREVRHNMWGVTNDPKGWQYEDFKGFPWKVAGKTGTAQLGLPGRNNNALFICFAPFDNPQVAVAALVEGGMSGGWIVTLARDLMGAYLGQAGYPDVPPTNETGIH